MDSVEIPAERITSEILSKCNMPVDDDHDERFGVPSLEELGKMYLFIYLLTCLLACVYACVCIRVYTCIC